MWILKKVEEFFSKFSKSYADNLEDYINSHNPQNEGDVERLTMEFHKRTYY
jgi:hypothetical protein